MSRSDNNPLSTQSSGVASAGSQNAEQLADRPLDLGIDYTNAPSSKTYKENRVKFDFSGYEIGPDGVLQKVTILSTKKKSDLEKAQEGECCRCLIA